MGSSNQTGVHGFVLLDDLPYDDPGDPLGFDLLVEDLASLILASRRSTPFTLGIEAAWGMGKSTLMSRLRKRLTAEPTVTPVWFNAWTADEGGVLEGLIKTVLNRLDPNVLRHALHNKRLISVLRFGVSIGAGFVGLGSAANAVWDRVANDPGARNELREMVEQGVEAWREKRPGLTEDQLLCVFVDDLDRCSPEGVLGVFEAMKLYLDVPGIVFVVGYDRNIVSDLVLKRKGYSEAIRSRDYLEKFIQIVYRIPRAPAGRAGALLESLLRTSNTEDLLGETERSLVIERSQSNPRRIKRFINGFVLAYGLDSRWRKFDPQSLVRIQLLHMHFDDFAAMLERRSKRDPIEEFLAYRTARDALRRQVKDEESWSKVVDVFESYGLAPPAPEDGREPEALLKSLEENVPVAFTPLADRDDFASLVQSIADAPGWATLRKALAEGALPPISAPAEEGEEGGRDGEGPSFDGLSVLWADDDPEGNRAYAEAMRRRGAKVVPVSDELRMRSVLNRRRFDVLISDIARGDDPEAGLDAVDRLRERSPDPTPPFVIFFVGRVTPARAQRAAELGAVLTASPAELLEFVEQAARERIAAEPVATKIDSAAIKA